VVSTVAPIHDAGPEAITWLAGGKHSKRLAGCRAAAIVGTREGLQGHPRGLAVADPELAIGQILDRFHLPPAGPAAGVHSTAILDPTARLGAGVAIGPFCVIGAGAVIGDATILHEGVSIGQEVQIGRECRVYPRSVIYDRCRLGDRVVLHAGAVIGADGFGFIFREGRHRRLAHIGTVVIEDDVEIGPQSCVDRAKVGATVIGRGTKIDALVLVAHNVQIGPLCVLAGQCGLSGSVRLGAGVAVGGQVGISDGVSVGDGAQLGAQSGLIGDLPPGQVVFGTPAQELKAEMKDVARIRRLARLYEGFTELTRRVAELEAAADHSRRG
jgi:UDP-3-O-[3-hydroxymyristoyl] glucosamine N-acyltransferase